MAFSDRELICRDCQGTFVFTAGEQEFYATKGLQHDPVRCPSCRASRRTMRPEERDEAPSYGVFVSWGGRTPRQLHAATCHECGQTTEIPFMPRGDRPVFCSNCYNAVRERQEAAEEAAAARLAALVAGTAATTEDVEDEDAEPAANVVVPAAE
jgi:CxxC-x17-CxxC domain-containing protein